MWFSLTDIDVPLTVAALSATAALVQALVAVVMMLGLRHTARAADAATAALRHQEATSTRQLRAYLDRVGTTFQGFTDGPSLIKLTVRNFGATPASNVLATMDHEVIAKVADAQTEFIDRPKGRVLIGTTIAAGAESTYFATLMPSEWRTDEAALRNGEKVVIFKLKLTYDDVFGESHFLNIVGATRGFTVNGDDPHNVQLVRRDGD